jgi:hypothetical protein
MLRAKVANLITAIEQAADHLKKAAGSDGILSRREYRRKLAELSGTQQALVDQFYRFICDREPSSQQRITNRDIQKGISDVKEKVINQFEIDCSELSNAEIDGLSEMGMTALTLAIQLKQSAQEGTSDLSGKEVADLIQPNVQNLFFDYLASEGSNPIEAISFSAQVSELTEASFAKALNLDPNNPAHVIERFVSADPFFPTFIEQHRVFEQEKHAVAIVSIMKTHLRQPAIVILGQDNDREVGPEHPAYIVGIAADGSLAGFQSVVIWT